jgi:hypothetical protein
MSRPRRRQVPKAARRRSLTGRGSHIGQPDDYVAMQAQSIARRYALKDRAQRPLHCYAQGKLMYDTEEIARSTGEALQRVRGQAYTTYPCRSGNHFHLTSMFQPESEVGREA